MMSDNKFNNVLAYIGDDSEFLKELEIRLRQYGSDKNRYVRKSYYPGVFLNVALLELPNIIIFEASKNSTNILHEELCFLKSVSLFKPIMLIAIFPDKDALENAETLLSCGLNLCYIKGSEYEHLYRDCQLYGFENKIMIPSFAKASNLKLRRKINYISTIAGITGDEIYIDSDVHLNSSYLKIKMPFLNDLQIREFEIIEHINHGLSYPMTDSYKAKYPFAGPWDEVTPEKLQAETVSKRLEEYSGELQINKNFVWIFSATHLVEKVFLHSLNGFFNVEFKNLDDLNCISELHYKRPSIIFLELDKNKDEDSSIMSILNDISKVDDYRPVFFIFNTKTSSHEFQVQNNYENIICSTRCLEFDFYTTIVSKLASKGHGPIHPSMTFKKEDRNRVLITENDIIILSLTEHEIEFEFISELSLFCIVQIMLPGKILITIVQSSKVDSDKWRYIGVFHGMDDLAYRHLRKIINQLIYNPKNGLSKEEIHSILYAPIKKVVAVSEVDEVIANAEQATETNPPVERSFIRPKRIGKSKL